MAAPHSTLWSHRFWRSFVQPVVVAILYIALALLGWMFAAMPGGLTPIWPPAGLALAFTFLQGPRVLPAIFIGGLGSVLLIADNWPVAVTFSAISTLEAALGAFLLHRMRFSPHLRRVRDVLGLAAVGGVAVPALAAATGVATLVLTGIAQSSDMPRVIMAWWLGDASAVMVLTPLILVYATSFDKYRHWRLKGSKAAEGGAIIAITMLTASFAFGAERLFGVLNLPMAFLALPPCLWAALRFHQRGGTICIMLVSIFATYMTAQGTGPFGGLPVLVQLFITYVYLFVCSSVTLTLGAAISERDANVAELGDANQRLERLNRERSRFLAATRHDLSQPLQAAHMFLTLLKQQETEAPPAKKRLLDTLGGALGSMDVTLNGLREIGQLESGAITPEIRDFPVANLLDQIAAENAALACRAGLRFRYLPCSRTIRSDPNLLGRILRNFLSNALRYTSRGGILLGCRLDGEALRIEVWDTGRGIAPELHQAAFDEFRRLEPDQLTSPDLGAGTGLGLTIVHHLALTLGHSIGLRSTLGRGSVFSITVPLAKTDAG